MSVVYFFLGVATLLCSAISAAAIYLYHLDKKYENVPGPPNDSFWFGCFPSFTKHGENPADYFTTLFQTYGKTFKMRLFNTVVVSSIDPDVIKELGISGRHPKPISLTQLFGWLFGVRYISDKSILTEVNIEKALWKRSQFIKMFTKGYFKDMAMDFNSAVDPLMNRLATIADGKTVVTMLDEFNHVTLYVLAKIAFGIELTSLESTTNPFTDAINVTFKGIALQRSNLFYRFNPMNWRTVHNVRKHAHFLRDFGKKLIRDRIEAKKRGDYVPEDILSLIVQMKENHPNIDEEELIDDFVLFFFAGQETTAGLLSFAIVSLGKHPEVLKKLQDEIDDVVGEKPVIEYNDLQKLTHLDLVLKETLRLYPPVFGSTRQPICDITFSGITIPKGSQTLLSTYASARCEDHFEDAFSFKPERFSPKAEKRVKPNIYFPFSLGQRTCLGKYFADMEAKIVLTKLIQRFDFKLDPNQSFDVLDVVTLRPKGRAAVTLTLRDQTS